MAENDRQTDEIALVLALATGSSNKDAAIAGGVSESTLYRRLEEPIFRDEVARARYMATLQACGIYASGAAKAMQKLIDLLDDEHPPNIQLGAARAILSEGYKFAESSAAQSQSHASPEDTAIAKRDDAMAKRAAEKAIEGRERRENLPFSERMMDGLFDRD